MPSPATSIAILALVLALGGSGYAIARLPENSVGTAQLRTGAVTGAKVRNGSLRAEDFRRGSLPQGPRGETGPRGPAGTSTGGSSVAAFSITNGVVSRVSMPDDWDRPAVTDAGDGAHRVTFDRSIAACTAVATAGFDEAGSAPRVATIDPDTGSERTILVRVGDVEGFPSASGDVGVMITCPD